MENLVSASLPVRSSTATLVIVGPRERLSEAATSLATIHEAGAVRAVLISTTPSGSAPPAPDDDLHAIEGLPLQFLNNAVAAQRLSSLPTVIWWRGGPPDALEGIAALADRVVLDAEDPLPLWSRAPAVFESTALTDVRWASLTRWRAAMAHFFDLPQICDQRDAFTRLTVTGSDRALCGLFAGWLDVSLGWQGRVTVDLKPGGAAMDSATLEGPRMCLSLSLLHASTCVNTDARIGDQVVASRVVSLGDQRLPALMSQELRVRSRDLAFERALQSALDAKMFEGGNS
jgi:glucose-6-phosphate dehydrogenase assembly protein OpcA